MTPKPGLPFTRAAVVGARGAVGSMLCSRLAAAGCEVTAIDIHKEPGSELNVMRYICADARAPNATALPALADAQVVVLAVPETIAIASWSQLARITSPRSLVVDTLSVKGAFCAAVRQSPPAGEFLSINPMFAPAAGFAGNNVAVVKVTGGPLTTAFVGLMQSWGGNITELTEEQHDRLAAAVQVATHAAVLAFGMTLRSLDYDAAAARSIATPPHRTALGLLARIMAGAPEVYWDIQSRNPHAGEVRRVMAASLNEMSRLVNLGDIAGFRSMLESLKPMLNAQPT